MSHELIGKLRLRQLQYFLTLAECRSLTAAAAKLEIAQPSLSEFAVRLEKELGTKLIIPTFYGIELTRAGAALARHCKDVLSQMEQALEQVIQLGNESMGHVALGLPPPLSIVLAVPLAETIGVEFPDIHLQINDTHSSEILGEIESSRLDMGVCYQGLDFRNCNARTLLQEQFFVLSAPDNWPSSTIVNGVVEAPIRFEDLARKHLVLSDRSYLFRKMIDRAAQIQGLKLNTIADINSPLNVVSMVTRATAYTIYPHSAAYQEVSEGSVILIPIEDAQLSITSYLVRRRGSEVSPASLVVEKTIIKVLAELIEKYGLRATLHADPK